MELFLQIIIINPIGLGELLLYQKILFLFLNLNKTIMTTIPP